MKCISVLRISFLLVALFSTLSRADDAFLQGVFREKKTRESHAEIFGLLASPNQSNIQKLKKLVEEGRFSATLVLRWAAHEHKQIEVARLLINEMGADVSDLIVQANAGRSNNVALMRLILERTKNPKPFLEMSASLADLDQLKARFEMCRDMGIQIDATLANHLMRHSVEQSRKDVARFLMEKGALSSEILKRSTSVVSNIAMLLFSLEFPQTKEALASAAQYAVAKKDTESLHILLKYLSESEMSQLESLEKQNPKLTFASQWEKSCDYNKCPALDQKDSLDLHIEKNLISEDYALFLVANWNEHYGPYKDRRDDFVLHLTSNKGAITSEGAVNNYIKGTTNHYKPPMTLTNGLSVLLANGFGDARWVFPQYAGYWSSNMSPELFTELIKKGHGTPNMLLQSAIKTRSVELLQVALGYGANVSELPSDLSTTAYDFIMDNKVTVACDNNIAFTQMSSYFGVEKALALLNTKCGRDTTSGFADKANEMLTRANVFKAHESEYWKKFQEQTYTHWSDYYTKLFMARMNELPAVRAKSSDVVDSLFARTKCLPGMDCLAHESMLRKLLSKSKTMREVVAVAVSLLEENNAFVLVYEDFFAKYRAQYQSLTRGIHMNMNTNVASEDFARALIHELGHMAMDGLFANQSEPFEKNSVAFEGPFVTMMKALTRLFGDQRTPKNDDELYANMMENIGLETSLSGTEQKLLKSAYFLLLHYKKENYKKEFAAEYVAHLDLIETFRPTSGAQSPFTQMQDYFSRIVGNKIRAKLGTNEDVKCEL